MIKKLLSVLITVSLLISSSVMPAWAEETDVNVVTEFKTENLVVNGGFEDGLDGWVTDDTGVFEIVEDTFTNSGGTVHNVVNGTKALKATSGDATAGYVYQEIDVTTNTNYVLNFSWFHLSGTKGSVKVYGDEISESNLLVSAGNIFGGETWYSSTSTFNSAEYEKIIIKIDFSYATAGVYYCIDNITLKAAGNTQTIGFENGYPEDFNIRTGQFEVTDEKAYKGSHSMKLTSGNGYPIANVAFALNPNTHYAVMFWYYIEEGSIAYASKYAHQNTWKDYTTSPIRTQTLTAKGEWKRAIVTPSDNVTGSGNNCFVEVAFQNMAANTVVYIDNIQCKYYDESVDSITVTGNNESDGILHADVKAYNYGYDFEDPVSYQWQRSSDKLTWSDVEGADTEDYRLTRSDSQKYVRVKVNTSNRYSASVVDSYYSKAILINDIGYKHKKGVSYGIEMQNESFAIDDYGAQADFELVNKTADELELSVFVGAYSDNGELIDYVVEEGINIVADGAEQISKAFSNTSIGSLGIIVFDNDMNVYYAEKLQDKGADTAVNKVSFDKDTQTIKITGTNGGTAELVIVKDSEGEIIYITALDCSDKTGYEVDVNIEADAYGKYSVFTSYCPDSVEVFYYSQEDYERVIGYFGDEMDKDMVLEAYRVLEVDSDLLAEIDEEKLAAVVNGVRTEVTGEELEEKKESAKAILKKMLILEAYNEGLSGIANSDGKIIYEDELELKGTDSDKTTFYKLYSTFLNKGNL